MPKKFKGSMAVARGSHKVPWRHEAYEAIGQDRTQHGGTKEELLDLLKRGSKFGTCNGLENTRSDLYAELEKVSEIFDLKRGDVIFATRLLFHRTMPVTEEGKTELQRIGKESLMRYSVRYVPGTARLPESFSTEYSLLDNPNNFGKTLNEVAEDPTNPCWHPQVWPTVEVGGKDGSMSLSIDNSKLKELEEKQKEAFAELRSLITQDKP